MTIFEQTLQWAKEQQLLIQQGEDYIDFQVNGQAGSFLSRVKALEEDGMVFVICAYPFRVAKEKRAEAALALDDITRELKLGAFYINEEDGQINFRLGQFLWPVDEAETNQRLRNMIMLAVSVADTYYQKILALAVEG
ncbi:MAG: YbjN domain-containing protein [Oscillospiraceae bacterium]|nr:YbjN domain-containing protein [Oscillospiraceae bacterium]MBP1577879.1 YbjN domain-containing protein [Oscillospiraceae bacterium]